MSRRCSILKEISHGAGREQSGTKEAQTLIDPRPSDFLLSLWTRPSCSLVAPSILREHGSHPHFAYEAETRQHTRSEPGCCECDVLHSVNRLRYLMLLRVGYACGVRHWSPCHTSSQTRPFFLASKPTPGRRAKSLSYHPIPPLSFVRSSAADSTCDGPASDPMAYSQLPSLWHSCQRLRRRVRDIHHKHYQ